MKDELIAKLMEIAGDFSIMLGQAVSDCKTGRFNVAKFANQLDSFRDDAKRKIRGY